MITAHECFNATNPDISQTAAASVRVAYPNISPVTAQFDNDKTVLVNWVSAGNSTNYWVSITDLDRGNQTQEVDDAPPFRYIPTVCGEPVNLNISVSPVDCADDPGFTHSDSISLTIPCPTTATEPETEATGESSGTLAMYPSLLAVVAVIPLLKWLY